MMYLFIWFSIKGRRVRLMSGAPLIKSMLFQLRLNCSARSHRLRWSPGDSTDLHNATQLAYIVYDKEKRDFSQFFSRLVTLLGRCDRVEEISVGSKARSSTHGFKSSPIVADCCSAAPSSSAFSRASTSGSGRLALCRV